MCKPTNAHYISECNQSYRERFNLIPKHQYTRSKERTTSKSLRLALVQDWRERKRAITGLLNRAILEVVTMRL